MPFAADEGVIVVAHRVRRAFVLDLTAAMRRWESTCRLGNSTLLSLQESTARRAND